MAVYVGTKGRNVRLSHTAQIQERINRGIMIKKILFLFLLVVNKWNINGTVMVPVPRSEVPLVRVPVLGANFKFCTGTDEDMVVNKWNTNGTVMVLVPVSAVPVIKVPVIGANFKYCTGTDEEMRDLGREQARTMTPEEEEELLNYSEEEGTGTQTGGGEDEEMKDAEEARQRAEKEAEESDRLAKLAEIQERIRRRKAEK
jgi:hypothetical protein